MKKKDEQKKEQPKEGEEKPKKQVKVVYYDDNSTVADMSGTRKGNVPPRQKSTMREKWRTFFTVMKKMVLPMLVTLTAFTLVYIILLAITGKL